jgi:hypothetical protein
MLRSQSPLRLSQMEDLRETKRAMSTYLPNQLRGTHMPNPAGMHAYMQLGHHHPTLCGKHSRSFPVREDK